MRGDWRQLPQSPLIFTIFVSPQLPCTVLKLFIWFSRSQFFHNFCCLFAALLGHSLQQFNLAVPLPCLGNKGHHLDRSGEA